MRRGIIALEEQAVPALDLPEDLPKDGEVPVEDKSSESVPKDNSDTPPTDGGSDPNAPPAEKAPEPDNKPIVVSDLNVMELERNEIKAQNKEAKKEHEKVVQATENAVSDLEMLHSAAEGFADCLYGSGTPATFKLSKRVYEAARSALSFPPMRRKVSVENYAEHSEKAFAMESIMDTVKQVIGAIINAIVSAINWLKKVFKEFFDSSRRLAKANEQMCDMFLKHRKDNEAKLRKLDSTSALDHERFVELPTHKLNLTYKGKQPGFGMVVEKYDTETGSKNDSVEPNYAQAFQELTKLLNIHEKFKERVSPKLIHEFEQLEKDIEENKSSSVQGFYPKEFLLPNARQVMHFDGTTCPDNARMFINEGYLGNVVYLLQMGAGSDSSPVIGLLSRYADFKAKIVTAEKTMSDAWMRNLATDEIKATFLATAAMTNEMVNLSKTTDSIEHTLEMMKSLMIKVKAKVGKDLDYQTDAAQFKNRAYTAMAAAASSLVNTTNSVLSGCASHAHDVQISWLYYINAIMRREQDMLKQMS